MCLNLLMIYIDSPHQQQQQKKYKEAIKKQGLVWHVSVRLFLMAIGSIKADYQVFGRMWIIYVLMGENWQGQRRLVKSGVLPDGTLTSRLVFLNGMPSLWDLSSLICWDKGRIFLRRCYFNTHIHTRTHTKVSWAKWGAGLPFSAGGKVKTRFLRLYTVIVRFWTFRL